MFLLIISAVQLSTCFSNYMFNIDGNIKILLASKYLHNINMWMYSLIDRLDQQTKRVKSGLNIAAFRTFPSKSHNI